MITFRSLKPDELESWFDHCVFVFNKGVPSESYRQYFVNHWYNDNQRDMDSILVAMDGDKIASTVRIFHRDIYIMGQKIPMGGIGEVSTKPEYTGKGLSTTLLNTAIKRMEELGMKVSLLGAGIWDYYKRLGWQNVPICWNISETVPDCCCNSLNIRPVNFDTDVPQLMEIYNRYSSAINGAVVRDSEFYWANWVKAHAANMFVLENDGQELSAYISLEEEGDALAVKEFGELPGQKGVFNGLLSAAVKAVGKTGCKLKYPHLIGSNIPAPETNDSLYIMARLIAPFEVGGVSVSDTQQLLKVLEGRKTEGERSGFMLWGIDNF